MWKPGQPKDVRATRVYEWHEWSILVLVHNPSIAHDLMTNRTGRKLLRTISGSKSYSTARSPYRLRDVLNPLPTRILINMESLLHSHWVTR
jgi:hypothetical protein